MAMAALPHHCCDGGAVAAGFFENSSR